MSSEGEGLNGLLQAKHPQVVYQGCASHLLNLANNEACKMLEPMFVNLNNFAVITKNSNNRIEKWREIVADLHETYEDIDLRKMPTQIGKTRWLGKHKALENVVNNETLFIAMYKQTHCLYTKPELKPKSVLVFDAIKEMFQFWSDYDNIVKAHMANQMLSLSKRTTIQLQKDGLHIYDMVNEITDLYNELTNLLTPDNQCIILANAVMFANSVSEKVNVREILIKKDASPKNWLQSFVHFFFMLCKEFTGGASV